MPWGRVEDDLHDNGKVATLSDKAFRVWWYSVSYCNKKRKDDPLGHLTRTEAVDLCHRCKALSTRAVEAVVKELSEPTEDRDGVFWEKNGKGFIVHDFPDYGPRQDTTVGERVARFRAKHADVTVGNGVTPDDDTPLPHMRGRPVPDPVPEPASTSEDPQQEATSKTDGPTRAIARRVPEPTDQEFESWWARYPRREGKHAAKEAYRKRRKARSAEALLAAAGHYADRAEQEGTEIRFIKHAATWLNQRCDEDWENGPPVPATPPRRPPNGGGSVLSRNLAKLGITPPARAS